MKPPAIVVSCLLEAGCTGPDIAQLVIVPQATPFYWYEDTTRFARCSSCAVSFGA